MEHAMSTYTDAIGYLRSLRDEVSMNWFSYACDLAVSATDGTLSRTNLDFLIGLFLHSKTYSPTAAPLPLLPTPGSTSAPPTHFLAELSAFTNFKRISPTLALRLHKRVTLIFGTNGSGKSSLCKTLKILARPDTPATPVNNVRARLPDSPSFCFRFVHDTAPTKWDATHGYGRYASEIKYFDSKIAIARITESLQPEAVVEVAPFRLEVFSFCRSYVEALRDEFAERIAVIQPRIAGDIHGIAQCFTGLLPPDEKAITDLSRGSHAALKTALAVYRPITEAEDSGFQEAAAALDRLLQATTEQGLRLLRTEVAAIRKLQASVQQFHDDAVAVSPTNTRQQVNELASKAKTQQALSATINPAGIQIAKFKVFLDASKAVLDFDNLTAAPCPFCRRPLDEQALGLVRQYQQFLTSSLEAEIYALTNSIDSSLSKLRDLKTFAFEGQDLVRGIVPEQLSSRLTDCLTLVKAAIPTTLDELSAFDIAGYDTHKQLQPLLASLDQEAVKREVTIASATSDRRTVDAEVARLKGVIQSHKYRQQFSASHDQLTALARQIDASEAMRELVQLTDFPTLLRKLTNQGKQAHRELVVGEFETILDREYRVLSGKGFADFGIQLKSRGEQQAVTIVPAIGDTAIERVLSEGEQKIHALALFFSELTTKPTDIVVFDDPVTSFDFNYTATFSERLRDFIRACPNSQVIVFTHNWDFFVQMQSVLNRSNLASLLSVMVLENCDVVEEYKEDLDDLKCKAQGILGTVGDLSRVQKEQLSGIMRRMIEAVVNRHVFNNQRHQYKQKSSPVSVFHDFTKLVALQSNEADRLRDLYANLSVTEHDDIRNAYVTRSKALFQQWFDEIVAIEANIVGRRP
jgi:energy-coupling factor transporter ATP-binding protein EcfA2